MFDEEGKAFGEPLQTRDEILSAAIGFEGGAAVLALFVGAWAGFPPGDFVHWSVWAWIWGVLGALPIIAAGWLLLKAPFSVMQGTREFIDEALMPSLRKCGIWDLAAIAGLAGLGEEMLFRGVLQPAMIYWLANPWWGVLAAAAFFGLLHPINPLYVVIATLFGVYFGWMTIATDSLIAPILAHGLYDFFALWFLVHLDRKENPEGLVRDNEPV